MDYTADIWENLSPCVYVIRANGCSIAFLMAAMWLPFQKPAGVMRDMTHSYVWCHSFVYVTWLIHMCTMPHCLFNRCHARIRDVTHSCTWRDSFVYVTWRIHMCTMAHYCWVIASLPVDPCLITVDSWQAIRQWVNRNESWCTCEWVTSRIRISHIIWVPHCLLAHYERWGAGVETHFQEI